MIADFSLFVLLEDVGGPMHIWADGEFGAKAAGEMLCCPGKNSFVYLSS